MSREKLIRDAAKDFLCETQYMVDNVAMAFIEGARWADENQPSPWISTDDFLPKIINNGGYSDIVLVIDENNNIELAILKKVADNYYEGKYDYYLGKVKEGLPNEE